MSMKLEEFKQTKAKLAEMRAEADRQAKLVFQDASKELFTAYPELEKFSWTQYTPYFADGDICEFGSNHTNAEINGKGCFWRKEDRTPLENAVADFLSVFDDDDMFSLWGDHARVIVARDGVSVDEYSHD